MSKFKVGDKVKVVKTNIHFDRFIGDILTIAYINSECCYNVNENSYLWYDDELELVEEQTQNNIDCITNDSIYYIKNDLKTTTILVDDINKQDIISKDEMKKMLDTYKCLKGEINMNNEVLKLYYNRKHDEIIAKYEEKEREFFEKNEFVKKYNEIIEKFEEDMEDLYRCIENFDNDYIVQNYDTYMYKYKINNDKLTDEFVDKYITERQEELKELDDLRDEIAAQLSLSDNLEHQVDVLINYGILDKKTKKMVN